ncbi:MAG: TlpA disulfide reductase family protein, partial [Acidobacteria bacterium]|nr:TlpA disulfide reductase family protein [Acidobacteriota bacterium]
PDFTGRRADGGSVQLAELRGKVVLLDFWGIWCAPCRQEVPELQRLYRDLRERGFEILAVNSGDTPRAVSRFIEEQGIEYPVILDDGIVTRYRVHVFPTHVLVDRQGHIRHRGLGSNLGKVRRLIVDLLEEPLR